MTVATIVIAEDEFWQPGLDFAAALRHRGHMVVRLVTETQEQIEGRGGLRRWAAVADRTVASAITEEGIPSKVGLAEIDACQPVDWQAAESILDWLSQMGYESRLNFVRSTPLPAHVVQDKLQLTRYLGSVGLPVPQTWDSLADLPASARGPFMFKIRHSGGGFGIHHCSTRADVARRIDQYPGSEYLVQRFLPDTPMVAAGVARGGEIVQMMTYYSTLNVARPFMMAYGLTVTDDPNVREYAADVVAALSVTGPFALDTVPGEDGKPMALDMNLRIWGSWTACQAAGMDVVGSYEAALGIGGPPVPLRSRPDEQAAILRRPPLGVRTRRQRAKWLISEAAEIRRRREWLGNRWARCSLRDAAGWAVKGQALDEPQP